MLWHKSGRPDHDERRSRLRRLTRRTGLQLMLLSAYRASFAAVGATVGEYITTPEAHGWSDQNTSTQNTSAFNAAIADASANAWRSSTGRGVVELVPSKTYTVRTSNGTDASPGSCLTVLDNVEIKIGRASCRERVEL